MAPGEGRLPTKIILVIVIARHGKPLEIASCKGLKKINKEKVDT